MKTILHSYFHLVLLSILTLSILNIDTLKAQHQPFGEEGAVWYMMQQHWPFAVHHIYHLKPFKISNVGETVIQDKLCQMLHFEEIGYYTPTALYSYTWNDTMYIHNDSGRIYYFDHLADHFKLVYDFNAEVGDTWFAGLPCEDSTYIHWDITMFQDSADFTVSEIGWLETEGPTLKKLYTNRAYPIIERIGWPGFFMPYFESLCQWLGHNDPTFMCSYYDPEVGLIKFRDYDCETLISIVSTGNVQDAPFVLSPNPASDVLRIEFLSQHASEDYLIEIFDSFGKQVLYRNLISNEVDIRHLSPGFYMVHIRTSEKFYSPTKLIVH